MNNFIAKLEEARRILPLKSLMERYGRGPANANWKSFPKCPYCQGNHCAGVFTGLYGDMFKCHRTACQSGTSDDQTAFDEIGFLAFELNVDRREATRTWLKDAGLWNDSDQPPANQSAAKPRIADSVVLSKPNEIDAVPPIFQEDDPEADLKEALQAFFERGRLSDADRLELNVKRGLHNDTIDGSGFLTNDRSNLAILEALAIEYPEWQLVNCGLYKHSSNVCKPSGQFYGYGVLGKKKRLPAALLESGDYDDLDDDDFAWAHKDDGLCNPILIPYFDLQGTLIGLRPHKGFPKGQKPRLYLAGGRLAVRQCKRAVIVEGEFKATALQQTVGTSWAVASVPGITQVKNWHVWADTLDWLKRIGARTVVVVFDNEEHGDARLASFRPQLENRFEAEIWARVCAVRLEREGYDARVGHLPDEWRNSHGKADWDGALAALLASGKTTDQIKGAFENVLHMAIRRSDLDRTKLFGAAEQIIQDRVAVLTYERALPWGGHAERKLGAELRKLAAGKLCEWAARVQMLAEAYEEVCGWYYELRISEQHKERLLTELRNVEGHERIFFIKLALKGTPSRVAPFWVQPYYVLIKPDGRRDRLVRLINNRNERTGVVALDQDSFTATRDWRRWLAGVGNFGWEKGESAFQALQRDINFLLARREVTQLVCYGCEDPGALWFLDDCAYAGDGTIIMPDGEGIFWHAGRGYTYLRDRDKTPQGEEAQSFRLKSPPRMSPSNGLVFDKSGKLQLQDGAMDDLQALRELLGSFIIYLNESYGGYDGLMLISAAVAYFGGPEIYHRRGEFPGIWITGEKGSGKTYTAKWLTAIHGFTELEAGLSFKTSSAVGAQIAMGQYANQPVWGDEFKENELRDGNVRGVVHGGFNREVPSKWASDGRVRTIRTNFLVTGESTCNNAATMSRFVSAVASRERRTGSEEEQMNRLTWLQDHRKFFFAIGRAVLQERATFAAKLVEHLAAWDRLPELAQTEPRGRFSSGVTFAAFLALNQIIPVYHPNDCADFKKWLIEKATVGTREISERVELNLFWKAVLAMLATGWFGKGPDDLGRYFKIVHNRRSVPKFSERQIKDTQEEPRRALVVPQIAIRTTLIFSKLNEYVRSQGGQLPPSQSDTQAQMRVHSYFVEPPPKGHQYKFGRGTTTNSYCWLIDLAVFPELGLREVSDQEWEASFYRDGNHENGFLPMEEWVDPRKGELFAIVEALQQKEGV